MKTYKYYIFNKPFRVLTQFSKVENKLCLSDFLKIENDVYPVGRLDYDSEGLLLLTNDGELNHRLISPKFNHSRRYLVQVENIPSDQDLEQLKKGIVIKDRLTKKLNVKRVDVPNNLEERIPPIRFRKNIPTSWLEIELFEGMNRQIRRMTAKIGFPTLRLIRTHIEFLSLKDLKSGNYRQLESNEITKLKQKIYGKI